MDRFNCIYLSSRLEAESFQLTLKSTRDFVLSDDVGVRLNKSLMTIATYRVLKHFNLISKCEICEIID